MNNIEHFFELIKESNMSLLGYRFEQERIKDEIISKLPHVVVPEINSSFSFKSFLRDMKIKSILETDESVKKPEYIVLDLNEVEFSRTNLISRQQQRRKIVEKVREDMYSNYSNVYPQTPPYKLLILSSLYSGINVNNSEISNFSSGITYLSDSVFILQDESLKIIKNRFGKAGDDILISFDRLKKYNYICNYENNN